MGLAVGGGRRAGPRRDLGHDRQFGSAREQGRPASVQLQEPAVSSLEGDSSHDRPAARQPPDRLRSDPLQPPPSPPCFELCVRARSSKRVRRERRCQRWLSTASFTFHSAHSSVSVWQGRGRSRLSSGSPASAAVCCCSNAPTHWSAPFDRPLNPLCGLDHAGAKDANFDLDGDGVIDEVDQFTLAQLFGIEEPPIRLTELASPDMFVKRLIQCFGSDVKDETGHPLFTIQMGQRLHDFVHKNLANEVRRSKYTRNTAMWTWSLLQTKCRPLLITSFRIYFHSPLGAGRSSAWAALLLTRVLGICARRSAKSSPPRSGWRCSGSRPLAERSRSRWRR